MAVRDRNLFAWQAYVIISAIVSVLVLAGMFVLWRSHSDLSKRFAEKDTLLTTAQREYATSEERVNRLLSMAGYGDYTDAELADMAGKFAGDERLSQIERDFAEQMKLFPPSQPASEKNFNKLPEFLLGTLRIRNKDLEKARTRELELQNQLTQTRTSETAARVDAVNKQKKAEADLEETRQSHQAERQRLNNEKEKALAQFAAYRNEFDRKLIKLRSDNQRLEQQTADQLVTIEAQMEELIQIKNLDFAAPQGEILKVANGGTEVYINLGSDDGLRRGVPFSVIDESEINISKATSKAKLVVTRIIAPHHCFAKVESYDYRRPIVPGDKVYSPVWRPDGATARFALVGLMDMNGDGKDDIAHVRDLIRVSGGIIDEVMDTKGVRSGPGMTPNTAFLVTGSDLMLPDNASPALRAIQEAKASTYAKFVSEAKQNGIMTMTLERLAGYLKTKGSDRTVPLGDRIRGADHPIRPTVTPPVSNGNVSEIFTRRRPN